MCIISLILVMLQTGSLKLADPMLDANYIPSLTGVSAGTGWNGGTGLPAPIPPPTPVVTLKSITINPASASIQTGQTLQFSASGSGSDGNPFQLGAVQWSVLPNGPTVSTQGLFTAGSVVGNYTVSATSLGISGTSAVTVTIPVMTAWLPLANPFAPNMPLNLAYDRINGVLYAVGKSLIFRSTDDGQTWSDITTGLPPQWGSETMFVSSTGALLLAINKAPGGTVTIPPQVWRWSKGVWSKSANITCNLRISGFIQDGSSIIASTAYQGDIWRSADDGSTFTRIASNIGATFGTFAGALWVITKGTDGSYLAGGETHETYRSTDHGSTWKPLGTTYIAGWKRNMNWLVEGPGGYFTDYQWSGFEPMRISVNGTWAKAGIWPAYTVVGKGSRDGAGHLLVNVAGVLYSSSDGATWKAVAGIDRVAGTCFDAQDRLFAVSVGGALPMGLYKANGVLP